MILWSTSFLPPDLLAMDSPMVRLSYTLAISTSHSDSNLWIGLTRIGQLPAILVKVILSSVAMHDPVSMLFEHVFQHWQLHTNICSQKTIHSPVCQFSSVSYDHHASRSLVLQCRFVFGTAMPPRFRHYNATDVQFRHTSCMHALPS